MSEAMVEFATFRLFALMDSVSEERPPKRREVKSVRRKG